MIPRTHRLVSVPALLLTALVGTSATVLEDVDFVEVTWRERMGTLQADKTSAVSIGDFNQDGWFDLLMSNHAKDYSQVFFGSPTFFNVTFIFPTREDKHGTAIGDYNSDGYPDLAVAVGGTNGLNPVEPVVGKSLPNGGFERMPGADIGVDGRKMRGVACRFLDIDADGDLDLFVLSRPPISSGPYAGEPYHSVFKNVDGSFVLVPDTGLEYGMNVGMAALDYNDDGHMDLLLLGWKAQLWEGDGNFNFREVSNAVFPGRQKGPFSGVAVLDYDNDGDQDIYLGAGQRGKKGPLVEQDDILLENRGGVFAKVSGIRNLPTGGSHIGISYGDFNNDGFLDLFLPREGDTERLTDVILMNDLGTGFDLIEDHNANSEPDDAQPTGVQVYDYDRDGRLDVVVSTRKSPKDGRLRMYKNRTFRRGMNYVVLILPVMDENKFSTMDAKVELQLFGMKLTRWCGQQGEFRTQSYVTDVHFGIGTRSAVVSARVTLTSGNVYEVNLGEQKVNSRVRVALDETTSVTPTVTVAPPVPVV